jgi:hypothetical protein
MANDPTLLRPMFNAIQPTLPTRQLSSPGISALPRPDVEAQNLRNLFTPTPPDASMGQPVQSFQVGGEVRPRGISEMYPAASMSPRAPNISDTYRRPAPPPMGPPVMRTPMDLSFGMPIEGGQMYNVGTGLPEGMAPVVRPSVQAPPASRAPTEMFTGPGGGEMYSNDPSRPVMSQLGERAAPPPPPDTREPVKPQGELELSLEAIRSRRAEDRKENALLALMQAGFATAAGQSPNALSNIGAGGQAGIAAFAGMERSSREDQRAAMQDLAARRRDMSAERLALMKLQEDPDTVKLFKSLGGGDLQKGFAMYNSDKKLQAAIAISKDLTADEGARREAISYLQRSIQGAGAGGGFAGFSARPVSQ